MSSTGSGGRRFRPEDHEEGGRRFKSENAERVPAGELRHSNEERAPQRSLDRRGDIDLGFTDISSGSKAEREDDYDDYIELQPRRTRSVREDTDDDFGYVNRSPYSRNAHARARRGFPIIPVIAVIIIIVGVFVTLNLLGFFGGDDEKKTSSVSSAPVSFASLSGEVATPTPTPTQPPTPTPPPLNTKYGSIHPELQVKKQEFVSNEDGQKVIHLTFDDGPSNLQDEFLDTLDEYGAKATFFISAQFFDDAQIVEAIKKLKSRGHQVAAHTYTHVYKDVYTSVETYLNDFKKINDLIKEATGEYSPIYRFPGGSDTGYNESIRKELFEEMNARGFVYYDWDVGSGDSEGLSVSEQVDRVLGNALYYEDCIILMHDGPDKQDTIESLHTLLPEFIDEGYSFKLLDPTVPPTQYAKISDYTE